MSKNSVEEAQKRYKDTVMSTNQRFPAIFIVADAGDNRNSIDNILKDKSLKTIKEEIRFDIVSTQFAMHYMFESEIKLRGYLHNVSCKLEDGGLFMGTTVDSDRLVYLIRESGKKNNLTIGNKFYSIVMGQDSFNN